MADNLDEFDQEELGPEVTSEGRSGAGIKDRIVAAWRTQPLFKLMAIMIVVGLALAGALGVFSGPTSPDRSKMVEAPQIDEPPGGKSSSYFIEQNKLANIERAREAMQKGGSALPTPVGENVDLGELGKDRTDPLAEFRAETERLRQEMERERQKNEQQMQMIQQTQRQEQMDDSLAKAMQKQMEQLMDSWAPRSMKVVETETLKEEEKRRKQKEDKETQNSDIQALPQQPTTSASSRPSSKILVQAGTVNYGQLLTEANSDVPGPILAQILSGPMAGGRAVGQFKTMRNYLVLEFNLVNFKGKDYPVNILALDPDTTLGGMATEVDNRYFDRVILPAAAAFVAQFGQTLGQGKTQVTANDSVVIVDQAGKSYKEALFAGMGEAGSAIAQFLQQEASQIKPLVRVAVGAPIGLFFLRSVHETPEQNFSAGSDQYSAAGQVQGIESVYGGQGGGIQGYGIPSMTPIQQLSGSQYQATGGYGYPAVGGGYYNPYSSGYQNPLTSKSGLTIITPGQQPTFGVNYYNR